MSNDCTPVLNPDLIGEKHNVCEIPNCHTTKPQRGDRCLRLNVRKRKVNAFVLASFLTLSPTHLHYLP